MNPKANNKYHAKGIKRDGEYYHSKAELEYAGVLELLLMAGRIQSFLHHPPAVIMCNGHVKWTVDYLVTNLDGDEYYVEVKGMPLEEFKVKFNVYLSEAPDHLPLFTVYRYAEGRFRIDPKYTINPAGIEMA